MTKKIQYINPEGLISNPAFSQIVTTHGKGKTIYIGGQNAVNANREIVGIGDISKQTGQVMDNIDTALKSCGAGFEHLIKLNIFITKGQDATAAFIASQKYLSRMPAPPAITVLFIEGMLNPEFLIEIDATAFLPEN